MAYLATGVFAYKMLDYVAIQLQSILDIPFSNISKKFFFYTLSMH